MCILLDKRFKIYWAFSSPFIFFADDSSCGSKHHSTRYQHVTLLYRFRNVGLVDILAYIPFPLSLLNFLQSL